MELAEVAGRDRDTGHEVAGAVDKFPLRLPGDRDAVAAVLAKQHRWQAMTFLNGTVGEVSCDMGAHHQVDDT